VSPGDSPPAAVVLGSNVGTPPDVPGIDVQLTCGSPGLGDHVSIQFSASPQQVSVGGIYTPPSN
jgi:hypothetical protein